MLSLFDDNEVEKYLGFSNYEILARQTAITPGRCKRRASSENLIRKRPASACSIRSPDAEIPKDILKMDTPKTPTKSNKSSSYKIRRTPCKLRKNESPLKTPKTPKGSDRFIPPRSSMNFSSSHHKMMQIASDDAENLMHQSSGNGLASPNKNVDWRYQDGIRCVLGDSNNTRILQYQAKGSTTPVKQQAPYVDGRNSSTIFSPNKTTSRKINLIPERVLDAPNYIDDYYLNLLHWSVSVDLLAVALDNSVYIWTPSTGDINHLCELEENDSYVTSVQWIEQGAHLAVGTVGGSVQLWDVHHKKRCRNMGGHIARVSSLAWNSHVLSSGSRSGVVNNLDVRLPSPVISTLHSHTQEVCGLTWSPSGRFLASGSNDNRVMVWDATHVHAGKGTPVMPMHSFDQHTAAVKALSWCPWQHNILASGGGSADKNIAFWNINSGTCFNVVETDSQVSSLLWNETYKEIVSGHGYPNNQLTIWQYPGMTRKADLLGHTNRVLQLSQSADGTKVMSAAGDETLRLWNAFELTADKRKEQKRRMDDGRGLLALSSIR